MVLDHSKRHHRFFEEMTQIPHGSFHEEAYSWYLVRFAQERGLRYIYDEMNNVIIYKDASKGMEDHPPLLLQAHTDMQCHKTPDSPHNFETDPLEIRIDPDGYLRANNTTLGADDGVGCAYMLAILDDTSLVHPALECAFTVQEEVGHHGVKLMKPEQFKARQMIGLDSSGGHEIWIGSMGGSRGQAIKTPQWEANDWNAYRITVSGLQMDRVSRLAQQHRNAIKLCARLLMRLQETLGAQLCTIDGSEAGDQRMVCHHCEAVVAIPAGDASVQATWENLVQMFRLELLRDEPDASLTLEPVQAAQRMTALCSQQVIRFLAMMPEGMRYADTTTAMGMGAALSLGAVKLQEDRLALQYIIFSSHNSFTDMFMDEVRALCELTGFVYDRLDYVPAWEVTEHSHLEDVVRQLTMERYGEELKVSYAGGGMECGAFSLMFPGMDIISMGAVYHDIHTPYERLLMSSFDETYDMLLQILRRL